jgi:hypothetical protein
MSHFHDEDDPISPAFGIILGAAISAVLWTLLTLLVRWVRG